MKNSSEISRRAFMGGVVTAAAATVLPSVFPAQPRRPNVLFIPADDLGYGDLSCYGRPDYTTSNLDRLAQQGRFSNAYSASPVCTPTRCAFHTGRYPPRTSVGLIEPLEWKKVLGDKINVLGLSPDHPTIASLLKAKHYRRIFVIPVTSSRYPPPQS